MERAGEKEKIPPENQVLAVMDLGAHSARMLIAECSKTEKIRILEDFDVSVPMGANVFQTGSVSAESIRILCDVFRGFRQKMAEYGVTRYRAIATSAVREAANAEILLERIRHETGMEICIYEGADEARLNYLSVRNVLPSGNRFYRTRSVMVDIGPGACQISVCEKGAMAFTETLKLGTLRVLEQLPGAISITALREYLAPVIDNAFGELNHSGIDLKCDQILAMGSSVRTLIRIFRKNAGRAVSRRLQKISRKEFDSMRADLASLSMEQISARFAVPRDQAESVIPCAIILDDLFRITGASELLVPMISLKQGLMSDFAHEIMTGTDRFERQTLELAERTALRYHCDEAYFQLTTRFAESLFTRLAPLHGLGRRSLLLLKIAAILHKSGLFINNQAYHKHSAYIISSTEIPGLSHEERIIASFTARYHRKTVPLAQHQDFQALPAPAKNEVRKLSALLRIACLLAARGLDPARVRIRLEHDRALILSDETRPFPLKSSVIRTDLDFFATVFAVQAVLQ